MTISFDAVWIPWIITIFFFGLIFRPSSGSDTFGIDAALRLFYLIPILLTWVIYLGLRLWLKG